MRGEIKKKIKVLNFFGKNKIWRPEDYVKTYLPTKSYENDQISFLKRNVGNSFQQRGIQFKREFDKVSLRVVNP